MDRREELRTELEAMLAAGRELSADTDRYLAEQFLDRLNAEPTRAKRQRRSPSRKPHSPGRTARALLVAVLALAIGTPVSLHANQNNGPSTIYPSTGMPHSCSWQTNLRFFHSKQDLAAFLEHANPKVYRVLHTSGDAARGFAVRGEQWGCR